MFSVKKPTEMLSEEHREVLGKLDEIEQLIGRLDKRDEVVDPLKRLAAFFSSDFWVHFTKEEEALFPEMEKFIPRNAGPIGAMLAEHEDLRKTNRELQSELARYFAGTDTAETGAAIRHYGTDFVTVLRDHIDKEDNILFRIADMHLTNGQNAVISEKFEQITTAKV